MFCTQKDIFSLLDHVKIDRFSIVCHFKCKKTNKSIVSKVPFEPYKGAIIITWKDVLFHPIESYKKYYHTPIVIYGNDHHETIVLKAFEKVSTHFRWNAQLQKYEFS